MIQYQASDDRKCGSDTRKRTRVCNCDVICNGVDLLTDAKTQCRNYIASIQSTDFKQPTSKKPTIPKIPPISKEGCTIFGAVICGFGVRLEIEHPFYQ